MVEKLILVPLSLFLGAYLGYWFAIKNGFTKIRLEKLTYIYTSLQEIAKYKVTITAAFALLDKEDPEFINAFFDMEAGEKLTKLCKELFGNPEFAMDNIYLPRDIQTRIERYYTKYFCFVSLEGIQHDLRQYFCIHTDASDTDLQAFFDDCYALHDLVEKKIMRLKRFFF